MERNDNQADVSLNFLLYHELYHYFTDIAISQLELLSKEAIYKRHKARYKNKSVYHLSKESNYSKIEDFT